MSHRNQPEHSPSRRQTPGDPRQLTAVSPTELLDRHEYEAATLRALQALTDTALSHISLEELLPNLLDRVLAVMRVDNAAILLLDEDTGELELRAARGPEEEVVGRVRIPVGDGFAGRISAERAPLAVEDLSTYPVSSSFLSQKLRSVLGVPLLAGGRMLGVVHIGSATPRRFTPAETDLLDLVADRIARAVERAHLFAAAETARKLAEQRAAFLNTTLEALGDGLVVTDAEGRVLYGNPAYAALLGLTPDRDDEGAGGTNGTNGTDGTMIASAASRLPELDVRDTHGAPLAASELAIARVLRGETLAGPNALEIGIRRLDGQEAFLSISGAPVRDASGARIGAVMALRDVTERRRLEQKARDAARQANERAARLEAIFASVADALFVYDADGHILERNPAASAMLAAFAPADMHEETVSERSRRIGGMRDTSGRELAEDEWPQTRIAHGEVFSGTSAAYVLMRRKDGQEVYLNVSGAPLRDDDGNIVGSVCLYRDITDRWELAESLRQRTQELEAANVQLRTLVDVLPVGVAIVDANGKSLLFNSAVRKIWGEDLVTADSAAQYDAYRAWRADTGQPVEAGEWGVARALSAGETSAGQAYDIETFDGQRKTILDSAAPLRDESGAITGAVSVILDITERRQAEQRTHDALEAFIALTSTLVEAPDDASGDAPGTPVTAPSDDSAESSRQRNTSPLARRLAELTRGILGCNLVAVSGVHEENGRLFDHPVAIVGIAPELERKWWTEQLAHQPHEVGAGMLPDDRERLLAGEVFTADLTRPPYEVPNDYGVTAILGAAMRTQGRIVGLLALDFNDPGGQPHVFTREEIQISEAVARLGAVVLERDRLLREREAARAETLALTEANRRMDEFLGIAGHELRTPITTIKANLQMAERRARQFLEADAHAGSSAQGQAGTVKPTTGKSRGTVDQLLHLLDRATQSAERQERLVRDLLDISRISSGRLEYRMAPQDLAAVIGETIEEQRLSNPTRRITLEAPPVPVRVVADADRLGQVLTNYLTNALKYSEADHPVALRLSRGDSYARVEVRDQGPGLSPEQQHYLFQRFHRAPGVKVLSGSGVGLGLGLYISKTIVEQHGGHVGVESEPGAGSTFWFELPLAASEPVSPLGAG